jgi:integrase
MGTSIAFSPPAAEPASISARISLLDLLQAIEKDNFYSKYYGMLQSTAKRICDFVNLPLEKIDTETLPDLLQRPGFNRDLTRRHYKLNARRSYLNYIRILIVCAKELGWISSRTALCAAWKEILDAIPKDGCRKIIRYAIWLGKTPAELTESDLDLWGQEMLDSGGSHRNVERVKRSFRRALASNGLAKLIPGISCPVEGKHYGVPLPLMPESLRKQIEDLLQWKQAKYAPGRGKRLRPITAQNLEYILCRLFGFARDVQGRKDIGSLAELVTEETILAFIEWSINKRGAEGYSLAGILRLLHAALRCYPGTKQQDYKWFRAVTAELPRPNQAEIRERKLEKYLDYEVLSKILRLMHAERNRAEKQGGKALAWLVHDLLLISWLLRLLWRQLNLRACRVKGSDPNIFKAPIPPLVNMAVPSWVGEKIKANPQEGIWQFRFRQEETKTGCERRGIVPQSLVPLLEEYLQYRPLLVRGADVETLFLNREGGPLTTGQVTNLVEDITWEYAHRRCNPHLFRDSFAFWWLERHPEDYLTLSKMLWHSNIQTTINIYGSKFDESAALCRVEKLLEEDANQSIPVASVSAGTVNQNGAAKPGTGTTSKSSGKAA